MMHRVEREIGGVTYSIETGRMAKQAGGSVVVQAGETMVLVTAVGSKSAKNDIDFFPLMVDYREQFYSAGKIPGGFFKREGRPGDRQTLTARLIDRPIRPLFPDGFRNEVIVTCLVISADGVNQPDMLAMVGASAALSLSPIPFAGPIGGGRIGRVNGQFVLNPTYEQTAQSDMDIIMAGSRDAVVMVEAGLKEVSEDDVLSALEFGHREIQAFMDLQDELVAKVQPTTMEYSVVKPDEELAATIRGLAFDRIKEASSNSDKLGRQDNIDAIVKDVLEKVTAEERFAGMGAMAKEILHDIEKEIVREEILSGSRPDGRRHDEIRKITIETGVVPRAHGSALFTRGQTQALVTATLGTVSERQRTDDIEGESNLRFLLHYNFPPFSVGEARPMRAPGRREIGHGALALRANEPLLPPEENFPYTIRVVSDILESNGSSSMASVCGASLALMDAGVPVKAPVSGIAMGLVMEGERYAVLSDIQGLEDHLGDMDFKVAGTESGLTALQMDIKIQGLSFEIMRKALAQGKDGRAFIMGKMKEALAGPRAEMSKYAPRITTVKIDKEKIRDIIGPGGKMIRKIVEESGAQVDVEDDGTVYISAVSGESGRKALEMINALTADVEVGKTYDGKVTRLMKFGAFVEILPGKEGLVHISQLDTKRVAEVEDAVKEGDPLRVKVIEIDDMNRVNLSRKAVIIEEQGGTFEMPSSRSGGGDRGDRGDRGGRDRGGRNDRDRGPRRR